MIPRLHKRGQSFKGACSYTRDGPGPKGGRLTRRGIAFSSRETSAITDDGNTAAAAIAVVPARTARRLTPAFLAIPRPFCSGPVQQGAEI